MRIIKYAADKSSLYTKVSIHNQVRLMLDLKTTYTIWKHQNLLHSLSLKQETLYLKTNILAWEFVTRSCLKPQNPGSNHEIHVLFEHGFNLKRPKLGPDLFAWCYTGKQCGCDWSFRPCFRSWKRLHAYIWCCSDVMLFESLTLTQFSFEKSSERKWIFNV